jgi:hypothetical protein
MQLIELNNFNAMEIYYSHDQLWLKEGEKILRREKLYNGMKKMILSKEDINVERYRNDIYLNSAVRFQMKVVDQVNKWEDIFAKDNKFCFDEKV